MSYVIKDHQGSMYATVTGNTVERYSFDAWGNRRNATTWNGLANDTPMFDRGFTGHEHLYNFGLINMNGRLLKSQNSNCETVDISSLESGVYILKVTMADGREFTERIVKL